MRAAKLLRAVLQCPFSVASSTERTWAGPWRPGKPRRPRNPARAASDCYCRPRGRQGRASSFSASVLCFAPVTLRGELRNGNSSVVRRSAAAAPFHPWRLARCGLATRNERESQHATAWPGATYGRTSTPRERQLFRFAFSSLSSGRLRQLRVVAALTSGTVSCAPRKTIEGSLPDARSSRLGQAALRGA